MKFAAYFFAFAFASSAFAATQAPKFEVEKSFDRQNLIADMKADGDAALSTVAQVPAANKSIAEIQKAETEMRALGTVLTPNRYSYTIYR